MVEHTNLDSATAFHSAQNDRGSVQKLTQCHAYLDKETQGGFILAYIAAVLLAARHCYVIDFCFRGNG